eukprot:5870520-Pyramimonas_sp.AAC.1
MASHILMPSPVQCSPVMAGKRSKPGWYSAESEFAVKSTPKPPLVRVSAVPCLPPDSDGARRSEKNSDGDDSQKGEGTEKEALE